MSNTFHRKGAVLNEWGVGQGRIAILATSAIGTADPAAANQVTLPVPLPYIDYKVVGGMLTLAVTSAPGAGDLVKLIGTHIGDNSDNTAIEGSHSIASATTLTTYIFSPNASGHGSVLANGGTGSAFATGGTPLVFTNPKWFSQYANSVLPTTNQSVLPKFVTTGLAGAEDVGVSQAWVIIEPYFSGQMSL